MTNPARREDRYARCWPAYGLAPLLLGIAASFAFGAAVAHAGLTATGDEFEIPTDPATFVAGPRVAIDSTGRFRVVWMSWNPLGASGWDIHSRPFDSSGAPLGGELAVPASSDGLQDSPTIAVSPRGDFLVAWSGAGDDNPCGTFARIYAATGAPSSAPFSLPPATVDVCRFGAWAADDGDGFLVAWLEHDRVAGVRLDTAGDARGTFATPVNLGFYPRVVADGLPNGHFVVAWSGYHWVDVPPDMGGEIGHVDGIDFDGNGVASGTFRANQTREDPTGDGFLVDGDDSLSLASDSLGNFTVGYSSRVPTYVYNVDDQVQGFNVGATVERFVDRSTQGSVFVAPEPATAASTELAMTPGGNVMVGYAAEGVFVRAIDCRGIDIGGPVRLQGREDAGSFYPAVVSINEAGQGVAVWQRSRENNGGFTLVGRRFQLTDACALCGDADRNGRITAVDALAALRTSVGSGDCPLDRCDTNGSQTIGSSDALRILKAAVSSRLTDLRCERKSTEASAP